MIYSDSLEKREVGTDKLVSVLKSKCLLLIEHSVNSFRKTSKLNHSSLFSKLNSCRGVHFYFNQPEPAMNFTSQSQHDIPVLNLSSLCCSVVIRGN